LTALGDRLGGWDSRDHDTFIRVWTQYVGPVAGAGGGGGAGVGTRKLSTGEGMEGESVEKEESGGEGTGRRRIGLDLGSKTAYLLRRRLAQAVQMKTEEEIEEHLLWWVTDPMKLRLYGCV
jgi:hypothetical protein